MTEKPNHTPSVSVIIPTYNSSGTLRLSLETVLGQDHVDFEVVVVGDGCTDDSEAAVQSLGDSRLRWLNLPKNSGGPSAPRNKGLSEARGTYVAYLGHDDLWFPWHLSALVACMEDLQVDLVASLGLNVAPYGISGSFSLPNEPWRRLSLLTPSNWLHRAHLTDRIGPWSTGILAGHDRDFLQRVRKAEVCTAVCRQLSVLKFPASQWSMYTLTSDFPQARYVESMQKDPAALRLEMLLDLASGTSLASWRPEEPRDRPFRLLKDMVLAPVYRYEPLRRSFDWLFYRRRRKRTGVDKLGRPSW